MDLYAFYDVAMARIAEQGKHSSMVVKTALSYIFCARRPLSIDELLHAMSVEGGETELCEDAIPDIQSLLSRSVGLIRTDTGSGSTSLVHHTLQEYLKKYPGKLVSQPETKLARVCLTYLTFDEFQGGPCNDGESLERRLQKYCFLGYASSHWGSHFRENQDDDEGMGLLQELLRDSRKLSSSLQTTHMAPKRRIRGWYNRFPKASHSIACCGLL